jgi:polyhydroxybutyrate depolymerase
MRLHRVVVCVAVLTVLASCTDDTRPAASSASSSASSAAASSAAPDCGRPHPAGQSTETFDFDGQSRAYELYVPRAYDGTTDVPIVFDFHGYGSNAKEQIVYGNFMPLADRDDFLVVALDGQGEGAGKHFNLGNEPGLQNDVDVTLALLDHLESTLCVDSTRVYATGMSDGGAMTSILACRASDTFAAFGPVAVIVFLPGCAPNTPISMTAFMGTDDPIVPFDGGQVRCCGGATLAPAPETLAKWADHDGCDPTFTDDLISSEVRKRVWHGCQGGSEVVFYIIEGGGHTWPGSIPVERLGKTTTQIDASATLWDFFESHHLG